MRFLATLFASAAIFGLPDNALADDTHQCLSDFTGPVITFTGDQPLQNYDFNVSEGHRLDARGATFYSQTVDPNDYRINPDPFIPYPVDMRDSGANVCFAGGAHVSLNPLDITHQQSKGTGTGESYVYPSRNSAAMMGKAIWTIYDGVRIHNQHDSIRPYWANTADPATTWQIRNSWISYNRDDCIEQDNPSTGFIDDNLFDGCYTFFSATWQSDIPLTYTFTNNLIRLQKMPGPFSFDDPTVEGHGTLFKAYGPGPRFALHNNIFLIDGYTTTRDHLEGTAESSFGELGFWTSRGKLTECSGNIIVWIPPESDPTAPFPGDVPDDPNCVTVTTDTTVWDNARANWIAAHPLVQRIPGVDDAPPASNAPPAAGYSYLCIDLDCDFEDLSDDRDGAVTVWRWDFGDGSTSPDPNPLHRFIVEGTYRVELKVWDDDGATGTAVKDITVTKPVIVCVPPANLNRGQQKKWIRENC